MNDLTNQGVSLLNLILPKSVVSVSEAITNAGAKGVFKFQREARFLMMAGSSKIFPHLLPSNICFKL